VPKGGLVGSGQPSLVWVWKISRKNPKFLTNQDKYLKNEPSQIYMDGDFINVQISDGSESKIFDPGRVESAIYGLGLENFP